MKGFQRPFGFAYWRLVLSCIVLFFLLLLAADFIYRKTIGQIVLEVRIAAISYEELLTDKGQFKLRGFSRRYYGRNDVKNKLRVGCKYEIALSLGVLARVSALFDGQSKRPFVEYVVRGIEEAEQGCTNLYLGT